MDKVFIVPTTFGTFHIQQENNGVKVLSPEGYPLLAFPKVAWWDMDNIVKSLTENKEKLAERYEYHKSYRK